MNNITSSVEKVSSSYSPKKKRWVKPTLQDLDISETNGQPGAPIGDGDLPNAPLDLSK